MTNSMAKPTQPKLVFRQFFDKDTGTFTYFLFDSETMEGLIIDPVKEQFGLSLQFIEELGVELKYVIDIMSMRIMLLLHLRIMKLLEQKVFLVSLPGLNVQIFFLKMEMS